MDVNLLKRIADVLDKLLDGTSKAIKSVINRENYSNISNTNRGSIIVNQLQLRGME